MSDLNQSRKGFTLKFVIDSIMGSATSEPREITSSRFGLPVKDKIRSSWFSVEFPGKNGLPKSSSARMQPILQMSALF